MAPPRMVKETQKLTDRIATLNCFMSKSADRYLPFFCAIKKLKEFQWTKECQRAFDELKAYLTLPPLLTRLTERETLYLYLSARDEAISSVLIKDDGVQKPVYYASKVLCDAETKYPEVEKLALALVVSARKLWPYFQAHTVVVLTNQTLKAVLSKPKVLRHLTKWVFKLSEFDVQYRQRPVIKVQALPPENAEGDHVDDEAQLQWKLFVDGSYNAKGSRAGLVLLTPDDVVLEYALRFDFLASNNEAEYEALLTSLQLASDLGSSYIEAFNDSQLVVNLVNGEYEAREQSMSKYLTKVQDIARHFQRFSLQRGPQAKNTRDDALSKLVSTSSGSPGHIVHVEKLLRTSIEETRVLPIEAKPSWMDPIVNFLSIGRLPEDRNEAK
ncbi:PREDICTED: uncharacterized protein LOC104586412 [Nelumbo nucifera]|uniref:Uncharacterized protein LOC104586412 n=1 Tax=Nelumbo nucifera TaxID=4432 RepID=A0A1U7Z575_NELNU|nr:PREDICTED: uncharacterized protein LOC104586412 [Nelumbo nucifera]